MADLGTVSGEIFLGFSSVPGEDYGNIDAVRVFDSLQGYEIALLAMMGGQLH